MSFRHLYEIRDYKPEDKNFILATFLRGIYYGDSWFSLIPKDIFMKNYKVFLENLIAKDSTIIKIACLPDDNNIIIGYSILGDDYQTIHFVYVKDLWRKKGIAKSLLPSYPISITHLTKLGKELMNKFQNVIFNPFK